MRSASKRLAPSSPGSPVLPLCVLMQLEYAIFDAFHLLGYAVHDEFIKASFSGQRPRLYSLSPWHVKPQAECEHAVANQAKLRKGC
jgi:hypothetical protein